MKLLKIRVYFPKGNISTFHYVIHSSFKKKKNLLSVYHGPGTMPEVADTMREERHWFCSTESSDHTDNPSIVIGRSGCLSCGGLEIQEKYLSI